MRAMTVSELRSLIAHEDSPCVSIYMPTHRGGSPENRAQFAGHVRRARELLSDGHKNGDVEKLIEPIAALDTQQFWEQQLDGLAILRSRSTLAHYYLPLAFEPLVVAAPSFHVRPLLRFLQSNQRYFLLNLSQGRVSLLKGSAMGLGPVDLSGMPRSLTDAIGVEHRERVIGSHSSGSKGNSPIYHGQGKDDGVRDEELLRFFRLVDRALWDVLRDETAPLIVATTERLHPMYSSVSRYPHLMRDGLRGNFSNAKLEDLHAKAWPIVEANRAERESDVLERYGNSISRAKALDDASSIARFAVQGRVRELLVERDAHMWGTMDSGTGAITLHEGQRGAHDDDVIDDVAEAVILRGGEVYSFERSKMPTRSPVAAVLRW
ncbi:MAG: hypothetical protein JNL28_02940 [Planctomycetes bacterium]|nr:hypothetical protein [Planctomycetota bacterium]